MDLMNPTPPLFISDPYVTFNPHMFNENVWSYRDLQKLCVKLKLGGRGSRDELIKRLRKWHESGASCKSSSGQNFTLLGVNVNFETARTSKSSQTQFLSPLKSKRGSSIRKTPCSILRKQSAYSPRSTPVKKRKALVFSPYNGVQLIPSRRRGSINE